MRRASLQTDSPASEVFVEYAPYMYIFGFPVQYTIEKGLLHVAVSYVDVWGFRRGWKDSWLG